MSKSKWIQQPHAGHYILGDKCRFVLNTYLGNGYLVSTIGELWNDREIRRMDASVYDDVYKTDWYKQNQHLKGNAFDAAYMKQYGYEYLGGGERRYETMVFKARKSPKDIECCEYEQVSGEDIDFDGYETAKDAREGHWAMCKKWDKRRQTDDQL